ncbi:MAG: proliferating cell nuclear antigen (pcna) [Candidatus Aenigmarchaeota archaeon ex4484_224]|nr:MAG: proliferating cell nuclear antigen (pcna) [Candidatus Aenigmarchaeota archaeon ex4484_224]
MFKAVLTDPDLLRIPITTIAQLIDEGVFNITKSNISLRAADRAMVAVVDFKILANAFEEYSIEEESKIGLNVSNFLSILKRAKRKDKLEMSLKENRLEILLTNGSRRRFSLPLIEIGEEEVPPIEQLEFTAKAEIRPEVLEDAIKDAEIVSDVILFLANKDKFIMKAEGDISQAEVVLEKGSENLLSLNVKGNEVKARYPIDYLKKMVKASKLADTIVIEFANDYPMKLSFRVLDKVDLTFVLAPRVIEE